MPKQREDQDELSFIIVPVRVTPGERKEMKHTAQYLRETVAEMLRRLHRQERHRLRLKPLRK